MINPEPPPANFVFILQKMHPTTGIYEICSVVTEDEDAGTFLEGDGVRKVEVFIVGKLNSPPINTYSSLEEFNGEE